MNFNKHILWILLILGSFRVSSQNIDINLLREINVHRNTHLDGTFQFISNSAFIPEIAFPAAFITIGLIKKDKVFRDRGLEMGGALLFSLVTYTSLKYIINRERPFVTYPEIQKLSGATDPSFPSGHTSASFALATSLSLNFPKWYVIVPAYVWASSVAYSRMDLGMHYPSDVLGGIIVGSGCAVLSHFINQKLHPKSKKELKPTD